MVPRPQKIQRRDSPSRLISSPFLPLLMGGRRHLGVWAFSCEIIGKAAQPAHCYLKRRNRPCEAAWGFSGICS